MNGGETVQIQIEGEFEYVFGSPSAVTVVVLSNSLSRLVGEIREKGDLSSGTMLSRIWDVSLPENEEEQFRNDLRAASGIGKSKGKGTVSSIFPSFIFS